jgi:hypothetical protein
MLHHRQIRIEGGCATDALDRAFALRIVSENNLGRITRKWLRVRRECEHIEFIYGFVNSRATRPTSLAEVRLQTDGFCENPVAIAFPQLAETRRLAPAKISGSRVWAFEESWEVSEITPARCRDNLDSTADLAENCRNKLDDHVDEMFQLVQKNPSRGFRDMKLNGVSSR